MIRFASLPRRLSSMVTVMEVWFGGNSNNNGNNRLTTTRLTFVIILVFCILGMISFTIRMFYGQSSSVSSLASSSPLIAAIDGKTTSPRTNTKSLFLDDQQQPPSSSSLSPLVSILRKKINDKQANDHQQSPSRLDRLLSKSREVIRMHSTNTTPTEDTTTSSSSSGTTTSLRTDTLDELSDRDIEDIILALSLTIDNHHKSVRNIETDKLASSLPSTPSSLQTSTSSASSPSSSSSRFPTYTSDIFPRNPYTSQTCYSQTDESELCTYEGTLCYDGSTVIVLVENPSMEGQILNDYSHTCVDARYYEPGSLEDGGCSYMNTGERKSFNTSAIPNPSQDTPLSLRLRRWGAVYRNGLLLYREMDMANIYGNQPENTFLPIDQIPLQYHHEYAPSNSSSSSTIHTHNSLTYQHPSHDNPSIINDTLILKNGPFTYPTAPDLILRRRTHSHNITIDWLDDDRYLWLAGIDGQWYANPYHWFSKIGALFDSQRVNRTTEFGQHPRDGFPQRMTTVVPNGRPTVKFANEISSLDSPVHNGTLNMNNRFRWRIGAQWNIPPMDYILFTGDGATAVPNKDSLQDWYRDTLELAIPSTTRYYFNNVLSQLNSRHLLCSTRGGAIPGGKPKLFTGRSDAWLYRQYTYNKLGLPKLGYKSHPLYPPRKITILDRQSNGQNRMIFNKTEFIQLLNATGLPYQFVPNMGHLKFHEQVTLMAGTGILIAPHGAALMNTMFLPAHAVVIEMFPYLMKKLTYRYLASMLDLHYYPYYSWELISPNRTDIYGVQLMNNYYFWNNCIAKNVSSYEGLLYHACNGASKSYPIVINPEQIRYILRDAVDTIGAFSLGNPQWKPIAEKEGIPIPPRPSYITDVPS